VDPKHKRRSYAARDYYEPNAGRSNLSLLTNALVSKIQMERTGGEAKATGVQFIVNGATHSVKVKKEVIVCGGSVNSPQILELSGVGSSAVLQKAGVELVVENVGVGENLNDHTATVVAVVSAQSSTVMGTC
jgi:choline dehydrogenase